MIEEELIGRSFAPVILLGPALRRVWGTLYGGSRESMVINALLSEKRLSLSRLARTCGASERAVRREDRCGGSTRVGWMRAILDRYRDAGVVVESDRGNSITFELNEASPVVALLREIRRIEQEPRPAPR